MPEITNGMPQELYDEIAKRGWLHGDIMNMTWGRRVSGDVYGITLERGGKKFSVSGPFTAVRVGEYSAIVRFG